MTQAMLFESVAQNGFNKSYRQGFGIELTRRQGNVVEVQNGFGIY